MSYLGGLFTGVWISQNSALSCQLVLDCSNPNEVVGEWIENDHNTNVEGRLIGSEVILKQTWGDQRKRRKLKGKLLRNHEELHFSYKEFNEDQNVISSTISFTREDKNPPLMKAESPFSRISFSARHLWQGHNQRNQLRGCLDGILYDLNSLEKESRSQLDKINQLKIDLSASERSGQDLQKMIRRLININESLHEANRIGKRMPHFLDEQSSESIDEHKLSHAKHAFRTGPFEDTQKSTLQQEILATREELSAVRKENQMYRTQIENSLECISKEENILEKLLFTIQQDFSEDGSLDRNEKQSSLSGEMSSSVYRGDSSSPIIVDCGLSVRRNLVHNINEVHDQIVRKLGTRIGILELRNTVLVNQLGDVIAQKVVHQGKELSIAENILPKSDNTVEQKLIHEQQGEIQKLRYIVDVLERKLQSQKDSYESKIADQKKETETFKSSFQSLLLSYQSVCNQVVELDQRRQLLLKESSNPENQKLKLRWKQMFQATLELQAEQYENEIRALTKNLMDVPEDNDRISGSRGYEDLIMEAEDMKLEDSPILKASVQQPLTPRVIKMSLTGDGSFDDFRYSWSTEPEEKGTEENSERRILTPSSNRSRTNIAIFADSEPKEAEKNQTPPTLQGMLSRAHDVLLQLDSLTENLSEAESHI